MNDSPSLKEYLERLVDAEHARLTREIEVRDNSIDELSERVDQRFGDVERAIREVKTATTEALDRALSSIKDSLQIATATTREALHAANGNIERALDAIDKRFEAVNEFRQTFADEQETFARKDEIAIRLGGIETRLADNTTRLNELTGVRSGQATVGAILVGGVSAFSALVAIAAVAFDLLRR